MITNLDRSYYFGASDTRFVVSNNWKSLSWQNWWKVKKGEMTNELYSLPMKVGDLYELPIIRKYESFIDKKLELNKQYVIEDLRLRVNLDANSEDTDYEIKTYKIDKTFRKWNPPKHYIEQVRVQMYASKLLNAKIVAYQVGQDEYEASECDPPTILEIDPLRIKVINVEQDEQWLKDIYLPRLKHLSMCLKENEEPNEALFHR